MKSRPNRFALTAAIFLGAILSALNFSITESEHLLSDASAFYDQDDRLAKLSTVTDDAISPLPPPPKQEFAMLALGRKLFNDKSLSADNSIACASCHDLARGGADGTKLSTGIHGAKQRVNTPTVFNSDLNFKQFWDGRADGLEQQALDSLSNPLEMGSSLPEVVAKLRGAQEYRPYLRTAGFKEVTGDLMLKAISSYEASLRTSDAPFDRFLKGDGTAISDRAFGGYKLFMSYGCIACHQGRSLGGNMFERIGIMGDYITDRGGVTEADFGRFNITLNSADKHVFKVPSLRNVALTAPYFHDGSAPSLEEAIKDMAQYQLGREINDDATESIAEFLKTLTGTQPK